MIVVDTNLLIYTVNVDDPFHVKTKVWFENILTGNEEIGLAWNAVLGFLRITTRDAAIARPLPVAQALSVVRWWLDQPNVFAIDPGVRHFEIFESLLLQVGTAGNHTSDAHLAPLAIEQNALLCSTDSGFGRFKGLRWQNPLSDT